MTHPTATRHRRLAGGGLPYAEQRILDLRAAINAADEAVEVYASTESHADLVRYLDAVQECESFVAAITSDLGITPGQAIRLADQAIARSQAGLPLFDATITGYDL